MKILVQYISGIFIRNFLVSILILTGLYLFQSILSHLIDEHWTLTQILYYNLLDIPNVMVQMIPPTVLMTTLLTLSGLSRTNELVACYAIGFGLRQIMGIVFSLVFVVCCLSISMQDRILPPLYKKRTLYFWRELKGRQDFYMDLKQDKIWYRSKNLIYNLEFFDTKTKTIRGMTVYTFDSEFQLVQVVSAKSGEYTPTGWILKDGITIVFSEIDHFPLGQKFEKRELQITETPKDFMEIDKEVDGLRIMELYKYIQKTKEAGADTKGYEVKLHKKGSQSLIPLVMALLALPFSTRGRREGSAVRDFSICLGITFFYWLFYSVGLSLGTNGTLPPALAAWFPSLIFTAVAAFLISRKRT
jgi:lipopolysaccharide export system permease protein